ncbi:probable cyclin-dependent serine/threonine-protein kinase DDB_G0292550 [Biomphalaria glabrata]|uniref:Probable cyclin-dependent serine/threonine-protein kinase DDB_G0292550 n=1 Tax=Biomphalaria glabrata TaxID=6526 RepID=A0A9W2ZXY8_BIOGL|nr:probable cyclin-dependent serine/threonine-protein kinase DDB_G0292550 [Biomphalaria glabrata]
METFRQQIIAEAKQLELKGKDLTGYVQQMVNIYRERIDKLEMEKAKLETERREKERDREAQLIKEEADRKLQYDLEKLRLDAELKKQNTNTYKTSNDNNTNDRPTVQSENINNSNSTSNGNNMNENRDNQSTNHWLRKKLQPFQEDKDSISDYLKRFEIKMSSCNIRESEWSQILLDFVQLTICQNHDHTIQNSYDTLKKELLNAYGHNASTFRKKYFENFPSSQIDPQTTVNLEKDYFCKWMSFEQIDQSYEGLKNFILIDNFTNKCESQLQSFIQERKPQTLEDIVTIMRTYSNAYPNSFSEKDKKQVDFVGYSKETKNKVRHESRNDRNRDNTNYREIICFNCQGRGHNAAHCKKVKYNRSENRDSYRKQSRKVELKENRNRNNTSRVYFTNDRDSRESSESEEVEEMNYCWGVEEIHFAEDETNRVRVHSGFINGKPMRFVKDSGCSTVGIRVT